MARHYIDSLLSEREKIILATRQHWFILVSAVFVEMVVILVILLAAVLSSIYLVAWVPVWVSILVGFVLMFLPIASMLRDFLIYNNHQFLVTNRRVIQISGIINKNVIDSSLEKVNDVKMTQSFFGRIFNYGDIEILTASELGANLFRRLEKPVRFKTAMLNAKEQLETIPREGGRSDDIPTLIAGLDKLRQQGVLSEAEFQQKKAELLSKL